VKSLGLDDLKPFKPEEKIIEYLLEGADDKKLISMTMEGFADETASESPAPGGGSVSAAVGALGVSLGTMVANLSSHKPGWDDRWEEYSVVAEKGQKLKEELLFLVDEDTRAFNRIMEAFGLPKGSDEEKKARKEAIQEASKYAIQVPFRVMERSLESMEVMQEMAEKGLEASISDVGVGALCARTAVMGAYLNVKINAGGLDDREFAEDHVKRGEELQKLAIEKEQEILGIVLSKIK
jgi:glutamate formiminotransferase/formiminotetrahydrofolate cyclodeaminase